MPKKEMTDRGSLAPFEYLNSNGQIYIVLAGTIGEPAMLIRKDDICTLDMDSAPDRSEPCFIVCGELLGDHWVFGKYYWQLEKASAVYAEICAIQES